MRALNRVAVLAMSLIISLPCAIAQDGTTTTPTTTTTPPAGKASDSDFLKDYETTTTPPATTTAVGPITPPPAVTPVLPPSSTHHAHDALKESPQAPKPPVASTQKPIVLKGRLEEIQGNGANLPVGLMLGLKAQKGKMDPGQTKPKADPLKGLVASFPLDWSGPWGGSLTVWWLQMDPSFYEFDPETAKAAAEILKRGAQGTTTFNFYQSGNQILVEPAKIVFPPRTSQTTQPVPGGANNPMAQMMMMLNTKIPVIMLGDYVGAGVGGNQLNSRVLKNDIKQIKPGVLEENIVVAERTREATGVVRDSFSEVVVRFTKQNANQLYVQAASIKYNQSGKFLCKEIYYGTVSRGVTTPDPTNPFAGMQGMPGMGSIPGMPTSPGGGQMPAGLDGLNEIIKQMQKGFGQ